MRSFRDQIEDILRLKVRNNDGQMVPLGRWRSVRETAAADADALQHVSGGGINGNFAPGFSSGDAIAMRGDVPTRNCRRRWRSSGPN